MPLFLGFGGDLMNVEEFFDNSLLDEEEIKSHSYEKCRNLVEEKVKKYLRATFKFMNLIPPRITVNYEMRYNSFTSNSTDKVGSFVERKVDAEIEAKKIYNIINQVWDRLSYNERVYFTEVLLYKHSENYAIDQMKNASRHLLKQIKESCIIKVAMAFGTEE